jgi:hypothetical protein
MEQNTVGRGFIPALYRGEDTFVRGWGHWGVPRGAGSPAIELDGQVRGLLRAAGDALRAGTGSLRQTS